MTTESELQTDVPHAARIWNYWMGGTDNFPADRAAGDAVVRVYPEIAVMARESRRFLTRVVRYLAEEAGIRQFLDIGTGLPTMQNTHEVAPAARVVYVDNDPLVLAHARRLGTGSYIHADYHEPERILAEAELDFSQPVAVMFMGVLGYEPDLDVVRSIVSRTLAGTAPGSHLVLWDGTNTTPAVVEGAKRLAESGGVPYILRGPDELASCFDGLPLIEPGLVPITRWRAEGDFIDAYGAVGRSLGA
ncbi:SAM-dependent methyltransferase [Actinoplanes awajinensis]|uniref:S-adenosyl methyltransferase n=1 Tax=Actinoplanes awajinensis subsp. mycoplanecinus TaxID=135947 RepID=A0A101J8Z6_9ACTN|nr:SAM-dependent methyltransferase [Actinoplanes awajinensis]KUL22370.1 S-adenosyl methyltransferase [Actinoplanes awajinensis subsp. mycoplanecinus]